MVSGIRSFTSISLLSTITPEVARYGLAFRDPPHSVLVGIRNGHSGSAKLFADAMKEEQEAQSTHKPFTRLPGLEEQHWTGEESMQDAVLRMLVDKYKPLRNGPIRTAEEKLKEAPPQIRVDSITASVSTRNLKEMASQPLLPAVEGHKPWLTTYRTPSHATVSIKFGNFSPRSARSPDKSDVDERTRQTERGLQKRKENASRLTRARESTLDYRLGIKNGHAQNDVSARPNPVSLRGWQSLIEDRIEKARMAGHFDKVKGRGKPIVRQTDEGNPFIGREQFLMNRIVQRNGAAPPWVEIQIELDAAINSFREPAAFLPSLTIDYVTSLRDVEWEERERSYHDTAINDVNSLVRKYNGLAPYAVRRSYYSRTAELDRVYKDCGEDILQGITERMKEQPGLHTRVSPTGFRRSSGDADSQTTYGFHFRLRVVIRNWFLRVTGRPS